MEFSCGCCLLKVGEHHFVCQAVSLEGPGDLAES